MITIIDGVKKWQITTPELARIQKGNHRVFGCTEKSFLCEHCGAVNCFYLENSIGFCLKCFEEIPRGDLLLSSLKYRIAYYLGLEGNFAYD